MLEGRKLGKSAYLQNVRGESIVIYKKLIPIGVDVARLPYRLAGCLKKTGGGRSQ